MYNEPDKYLYIVHELTALVLAIIESGYHYDKSNNLIITKSRSQLMEKIYKAIDEYCIMREVDKKVVLPLLKEQIKVHKELKFNKTERNMAMDLLNIEDDNEER